METLETLGSTTDHPWWLAVLYESHDSYSYYGHNIALPVLYGHTSYMSHMTHIVWRQTAHGQYTLIHPLKLVT